MVGQAVEECLACDNDVRLSCLCFGVDLTAVDIGLGGCLRADRAARFDSQLCVELL